MFSKSCAVLTLSTIGLLCLCWLNVFVCSDKISRRHDISGKTHDNDARVFGRGHLVQTEVLTFTFNRKQMHRMFVVNFIQTFLLFVFSIKDHEVGRCTSQLIARSIKSGAKGNLA